MHHQLIRSTGFQVLLQACYDLCLTSVKCKGSRLGGCAANGGLATVVCRRSMCVPQAKCGGVCACACACVCQWALGTGWMHTELDAHRAGCTHTCAFVCSCTHLLEVLQQKQLEGCCPDAADGAVLWAHACGAAVVAVMRHRCSCDAVLLSLRCWPCQVFSMCLATGTPVHATGSSIANSIPQSLQLCSLSCIVPALLRAELHLHSTATCLTEGVPRPM